MPKGTIKKPTIDSENFRNVLKEKNISIRELGKNEYNICSEKTIRRALKEGKIRESILNDIAKKIGVHPDYLAGKRKKYIKIGNVIVKRDSRDFTYFSKQVEENQKKSIDLFWESLLLLFEISKNQFDELPIEKQYDFQHEVFEGLEKIIIKYFDRDGAGDESHPNLYKTRNDLENQKENLKIEECLRDKYMKILPFGYTEKQIRKMSLQELVGLDMELSNYFEGWNEIEDPFAEKYEHLDS